MKTNVLALLAFASLAVAQFEKLPPCAQDCASTALQAGIGNCGTGVACICGNESFISDISCCLVDACTPEDQQKAIDFAHQLCSAAGVQVPDKPNCTKAPSSSAAAGQSTATSSSSSSEASGTMNIQTSTPTGTATSSGGAGGAISSAVSSVRSAASSAASSALSSATSPNWGPARPTGASGQVMGAIGGLVAAVALL